MGRWRCRRRALKNRSARRLVAVGSRACYVRHGITQSAVEFRVLGPLEAVEGGRTLPLGGPKQRALLALLLLDAGRVVSTDRLIDELWGERPPATAAHSVQVYVSGLRKALERVGAKRVLVTRAPGYLVDIAPDCLDLHRFERMVAEGRNELDGREPARAADLLRRALDLWRGPALADLAVESLASAAAARLEELRLAVVEERVEADLALGRHADVVGELEDVIAEYPLRERPRGQLMLALYRAGRQAEALQAYQDARRVLVDELGIDPSPSLQRLERAILTQDPSLDLAASRPERVSPPEPAPERSVLLVASRASELDALLRVAEPLAYGRTPHRLLLVCLLAGAQELASVTSELHERRARLEQRGITAHAAAFTADEPGAEAVRLAARQEVDLLLVPGGLHQGALGDELRLIAEDAPCDVAVLAGGPSELSVSAPVLVPFGGGEHDWAALEVGAWLAGGLGVPLRLYGLTAAESAGRRDASRLLAAASLAVQHLAGVPAEPVLGAAGGEAVLRAGQDATAVVLGLSERWRQEGLGDVRAAIVDGLVAPALVVRRGVRPGGLTPDPDLTRFTWSLHVAEPAGVSA